jgi:hypothetical protein
MRQRHPNEDLFSLLALNPRFLREALGATDTLKNDWIGRHEISSGSLGQPDATDMMLVIERHCLTGNFKSRNKRPQDSDGMLVTVPFVVACIVSSAVTRRNEALATFGTTSE